MTKGMPITPLATSEPDGKWRIRPTRALLAALLFMSGPIISVGSAHADPGDYSATREGAEAACKARDLRGFFDVFVRSPEARQYFSGDTITYTVKERGGRIVSSKDFSPLNYHRFPIYAADYWYFPTEPSRSGAPKEYIDVTVAPVSPALFQVDWAYVHYDGKDGDGEYLGNMIDRHGHVVPEGSHPAADGRLAFYRKNNCWYLLSDLRFASTR